MWNVDAQTFDNDFFFVFAQVKIFVKAHTYTQFLVFVKVKQGKRKVTMSIVYSQEQKK